MVAAPQTICVTSQVLKSLLQKIPALSSIQDGLASVSLKHTNHYIFFFSPHQTNSHGGILHATAHTQALK
jgi:hypothetical protein